MGDRERDVRLDGVDVDTQTGPRGFFSLMSIERPRKPSPGTGIAPASGQESMDHLKTRARLGAQPDPCIR